MIPHHTCCMLGPKARKYADNSGNPIGTAAKKAFKAHKKRERQRSRFNTLVYMFWFRSMFLS